MTEISACWSISFPTVSRLSRQWSDSATAQIGELVGKLTDEFRAQHPAVPWRQIKAMRNIVAHSYGTVDPETTWEIITDDIPALKKYCETIIASQQ